MNLLGRVFLAGLTYDDAVSPEDFSHLADDDLLLALEGRRRGFVVRPQLQFRIFCLQVK